MKGCNVSKVRIGFQIDDPVRKGGLTCGQRYIWDIIESLQPNDEHLNVRDIIEIPEGCTTEAVATAIRVVVEAHDALRTNYFTEDDGEITQFVCTAGTLSLDTVELGPEGSVSEALIVMHRLAAPRFNLRVDLPLRACLALRDGAPKFLLIAVSHMACDGWGEHVLVQQLAGLLGGADPDAVIPAPSWQPLDQLAYEASPQGEAKGRKALEYMRSRLSTFPERLFSHEAFTPLPKRFWEGRLDAAALTSVAEAVAEAQGISSPAVIMAAVAKSLSKFTGIEVFAFAMRTFNRYHARSRNAVGHFSQDIPVLIGALDRPLPELARDLQAEIANILRCAHVWPPDLRRVVAEISAQRGIDLRVDAVVNCMNTLQKTSLRNSDEDLEQLRQRASESEFAWVVKRTDEKIKFLFSSNPRRIMLLADTAHLPPDMITAFLYEVQEAVMVGFPEP
jgi:hypothetical protein